VPFARTNLRKGSIKFTGPKLWNALSAELKACRTIFLFWEKFEKALSSNLLGSKLVYASLLV